MRMTVHSAFARPLTARLALAAVLALVLGAPLARSAEPAPDKKEEQAWLVTPHLPADTLFVASFKDIKQAAAKFQKTGLWQILNDPELQQQFQFPLMAFKGKLKAVEQQFALKFDELANQFQGEAVVAVLGYLPDRAEDGKRIPELMLSFNPGDQAAAWMEHWQRMLERFQQEFLTPNGATLETNSARFGGSDVVTLSVQNFPIQLTYALSGGQFLLTNGAGRIEKLLAARESVKAGQADAKAKTLGGTDAFQRALKNAGDDAAGLFYFNLNALRADKENALDGGDDPAKKAAFDLLGVPGIQALSYSVSFKSNGLKECFFVDAPAASRTGVLTLFDGAAIAPDAFQLAPRNSLVAVALHLDPSKLLDRTLDFVARNNPAMKEQFEAIVDQFKKNFDVDLRQDLLGAFTGQSVFSVSMPSRNPKVPLGMPRPILTLGVKDVAAATKLVNALRRTLGDTMEFTDVPYQNQNIVHVRPKNGAGPGFSWTLYKDKLILSAYPLALKDELERLSAPTQAEAALADDPAFKEARATLNGQPMALVYLDLGSVATALYDTAIPVLQSRKPALPIFNPLYLPSASLLSKNLAGAVLAFSSDAEGLRMESYSAAGPVGLVIPIAGAMAAYFRAGGEAQVQAVDAAEPGLDLEMQPKLKLIREVTRGLKQYARDNANKMPEKLADIAKYINVDAAKELDSLTYLGQQAEKNRVVAYPTEAKGKTMPVLLQDGNPRIIYTGQLERVLKEGWLAQKAKPYEATTRPPEPPKGDF